MTLGVSRLRTRVAERSVDGNIGPKKEEVKYGLKNCATKTIIMNGIGESCSTPDEDYETVRILIGKLQTH